MRQDLGLEDLLKDDKKNSKEDVKSNQYDFSLLLELCNKKDISSLKSITQKILSENKDSSLNGCLGKLLEIFLNLEGNDVPSFVLLAPFGEVCENIKKFVISKEKEDNLNDVLKLGKLLYGKFKDNLAKLGEDNLITVLEKYADMFSKVGDSDFMYDYQTSKREKEYIEEITLSKQFTHNRKRKIIFWLLLLGIIVFGGIIIYINELFDFRKIRSLDFISFENIEYKLNFDENESGALEKEVVLKDDVNRDGYHLESFLDSIHKKNKNIFSLGKYEIVKKAPVMLEPNKQAKIIGKFNVGDKIKVVGKEKEFYKIISKDKKSFGYVPISSCRFLISDK